VNAIPLFFLFFAFRWLGLRRAGDALIRALDDDSPNITQRQTIAGIFLVRSGRRALPILESALRSRHASPLLIRVAGDTELAELRPAIEQYLASPDPAVVRAAQDALRA
jgi:HEAT repeat protein